MNRKPPKIFLHNLYPLFQTQDIIWSILQNRFSARVTHKLDEADIILLGPFHFSGIRKTLSLEVFRHLKNKFFENSNALVKNSIRQLLDPNHSKVWIHISGEVPGLSPNGSFYNSECDYGIGHESMVNSNYVHMPHWYQSIDWSNIGLNRSDNAFYRLGAPINVHELLQEKSATLFRHRPKRCALISSHLTTPRDVLIREIEKVMPVDLFGISGSGPVQFRNKTPKRELLSNYTFSLCPENRLYPGYITEKIPEAFVSGAHPIGWYLHGSAMEFHSQAHINCASESDRGISGDGTLAHYINARYTQLCKEGSPALIHQAPSLDPVIALLERAVAHSR